MNPPQIKIPRGSSGTLHCIMREQDGTPLNLTAATSLKAKFQVNYVPYFDYALEGVLPVREMTVNVDNTADAQIPYSAEDTKLLPTGPVVIDIEAVIDGETIIRRFFPATIINSAFGCS